MTSIGEIANETKAILEDVRTNTLGTQNNTSQIISQLSSLKATTQAGFSNLASGTAVLVELGQQANALSAENLTQNQTIICWLGDIAHVLCDVKHDLDASLIEQRRTNARLGHIDSVLELVHAREAVEVATRDRLQAEIEACCPPRVPEPGPCFTECKSTEIPPFKPVKTDWKPIAFPKSDVPN